MLPDIGLVVRVFANDLEDLSQIPGRVIPKTQKMVLDASLLNTQHYKVWIKGKWSNPGKRVAPSQTPWFSSYWKGSLRVILDYGRQLLYKYIYMFLFIYIYVYMYVLIYTYIYVLFIYIYIHMFFIYTYIYIYFFSSYNVWKHVRHPSFISRQPGW